MREHFVCCPGVNMFWLWFPYVVLMVSLCFPYGFLMDSLCFWWISCFAENNYKMWGSILCCSGVNMFCLWLPYNFLMVSLWFPDVPFDFRVLPKIITRCEGAFCVLLWCKYVLLMVSLCFPYGFLMLSFCFPCRFLMFLLNFVFCRE